MSPAFEKPLRATRDYIHSHYNTVEWIFTVRLLILAFMLLFSAQPMLDQRVFPDINDDYIGLWFALLGLFGIKTSAQHAHWGCCNFIFAILVFMTAGLVAVFFVLHNVWDNPLLYIASFDTMTAVWLAWRVAFERFEYLKYVSIFSTEQR
jgi:hypothetical protein